MRDEEITIKIKNAIDILNEIDKMIDTQSKELQTVDYELSDLYHIIENNNLDKEQSHKIVKRIHDLRATRRGLNNEHEIENTFNTHKAKITGNSTRQFLASEILKTVKKLDNDYKNRILTDEMVAELLKTETTKRGRPKKTKVLDNDKLEN